MGELLVQDVEQPFHENEAPNLTTKALIQESELREVSEERLVQDVQALFLDDEALDLASKALDVESRRISLESKLLCLEE